MSSGQTLAQMNLTCLWLETILYGINCILFGTCVYVISIKGPAYSKLLLCATSFQFALATTHVILMFVQAMIAFTNATNVITPDGANFYYAATAGNRVFLFCQLIYISNVFTQELLLIWRLYVVWNQNIKVCILPVIQTMDSDVVNDTEPLLQLIMWVAHCVTASIAVALLAPKHTNIFSHTFRAFALCGWSLEMVLNVTVTTGIVYRIWRTGKQTAALTTGGSSGFRYKSTIITIVESGALITTCTCVIFLLWVAGNVSGLVAVDIAIQVATMTPLLIIVRAGLKRSHSSLQVGSSGGHSSSYPRSLEFNVATVSDHPMDVISKCGTKGKD
ncbi:uncharacterized protein HD556DRAFT_1439890 [Suillus plorans]|uniref:Uncharacterized protein n=1 Tax=Suillus plorans TaxID=116603 RepID=A0A9P7J0I2_9AGAM|nr:uncharacterized protein HD556DRAFT_1439890 [Suillus plorans]KAG1798830.1 hypothetical protein HD556DRAFT_1439890 [Suillus plorans]